MRRRLLVSTLILSLLIALLPGLTSANGTPPAIAVVASSTQVATGQTFDLFVQITGASNVYGSSVDLAYDPTLLEYMEGSAQGLVSAGLTADQYYASILNRSFESPARLSVIAIRLGRTIGGASGEGNLASLKFKALREGQATFTVNGTSLDVQMVDPTNASIEYSASATGVTVQIGPAPAAPTITEPAQGAYLSSRTFEVQGTAPASSVLRPSINGADQATVNVGSDGLFSFPLTVGTDGQHTVSVRESTVATADSQTVFTVDTIAPVLGSVTATAVTQSTISGMVTEVNLDKLFVQVNPTGDPVETDAVTVETDGSYSVNRALGFGSNLIKVTAVDKAGNTAMTTTTVDVADVSSPGTVTGQVSLAGRGPSARAGATVKVVGHAISAVTAADGTFTLQGVPGGAQKLLIRFPNPHGTTPAYLTYLAQVINIDVTIGSAVAVPLVVLKGGDANGDNLVGLTDLVILAKNYGLDHLSVAYDPRADFNGDNVIGLTDLVILAGAYGFEGAPIPANE